MKVKERRLKLNRETLRMLTGPELVQVNGASGLCFAGEKLGAGPALEKGGPAVAVVVSPVTNAQAARPTRERCPTGIRDTDPVGACTPGAP